MAQSQDTYVTSLVFSSSELGAISYVGACSSATTAAVAGENEIALNHLNDGTYTDCELRVTDAAGNVGVLVLSSFTVDTNPPNLGLSTPIASLVNNSTPSLIFSSSEPGTIVYEGLVQELRPQQFLGENEITLTISMMAHADCRLKVTDAAGNTRCPGFGQLSRSILLHLAPRSLRRFFH